MKWHAKRVLALAPHTDDVEIGTGGTVNRLIQEGAEVHCLVFSTAKESLPEGLPEDILAHEVREASAHLGVPDSNLSVLDYPVRNFPEHRQAILEDLVKVRNSFAPELVLVCASSDVHQDHNTVYNEAVRAFKDKTILGYDLPWNMIEFRSQLVIALTKAHIDAKVRAVLAYNSQKHRRYVREELIRGLAVLRGIPISEPFAEAFEVIRWVVPHDPDGS